MSDKTRIAIVGLGYVGLPLAVALARHFPVTGFDIGARRIAELKSGNDRTGEVSRDDLLASRLKVTASSADIAGSDVFIVTVPTPVDAHNQPDLGPLRAASETVGRQLAQSPVRGAIVVFESTVYPGVTEQVCGPILERASGLAAGVDFFLGYSPERINPGDREHTVDRITKVVAGQTPAVALTLKTIYGAINGGNIFVARDIRTAEAAKVIENAQRDINIAFINEVAMIFEKLGLSAHDVLDAAATKWNFLKFTPGLVGGHCIGVDPFYLAHLAQEVGHDPAVILAGRRINDAMGEFVAGRIDAQLPRGARTLVLGLTFKENVPDLRNSKVVDIVAGLKRRGHSVDVHDPLADPGEAQEQYGLALVPRLDGIGGYDAVIGAVNHAVFGTMTAAALRRLAKQGGLIADVKGIWRKLALGDGLRYWQL
ncbi:MAG TPA: nucleotide sugar dehydrogenase [Candidatus Cybelea sp.]|nr:nucleotide sugar dehydrogenase [Candidatus Cybelea sp.]